MVTCERGKGAGGPLRLWAALSGVCAGAVFLLAVVSGCGGKSATVPSPFYGKGNLEGTVFVDEYNAARSAGAATSAPSGKVALASATVAIDTGESDITDAQGYFLITDIQDGPYTLTMSHPNYGTETHTVTVVANTTANLNEVLGNDAMTLHPAATGTLVVSAYASSTVPTPITTATVWIDGASTGVQTDPVATFDNIAAGATYTVVVKADGYQDPAEQQAAITEGQTTTLSFGLMPTSGNFPPAASIITPTDDARFTEGATITFSGAGVDSEDGNLTGSSLVWTSSEDGQLGTGTMLEKNDLSVATHTITITVTDSGGETGNDTVVIGVIASTENTAPTATIVTPTSGTTYTSGQSIGFSGAGTDAEDGTLTGSSLVWTSSLDGSLGTGNLLTLTDLSVGTHTITLTATDSTSLTGTDTVTITVNQASTANAPTAVIATPASGAEYVEGQNIIFSGSATDPEDGTLTGTSLAWSSSIDGSLGTGTMLTKSNLSVGAHTITLTATDSDSNSDTETITITIVESTGNAAPTATIVTPPDGSTFSSGDYIWFSGAGTDAEDGTLTGTSLVWTSSEDGPLGTGASVLKNDLSTGTHTIILTVTDSGNLTDTATVSITVQ